MKNDLALLWLIIKSSAGAIGIIVLIGAFLAIALGLDHGIQMIDEALK